MTKKIRVIFLFIATVFLSCTPIKQPSEVIIQIPQTDELSPEWLKVEILSDEIIHVIASNNKDFKSSESLMAIERNWPSVDWKKEETEKKIKITTNSLTLEIDKQKGSIEYFDKNGNILLSEIAEQPKKILPANVLGEETNHIQQIFNSPDDEAVYGLGAHQNGVMNYKGHDVDLWQYNIVNVIPFLVSSKNYGILWDNNSRTKFGDIRDYESISSLKLYDKNGNEGGLSAEYFKDEKFQSLFTSQIENRIEHEFIDINDEFPEGFSENVSAIRWSGKISADESGEYKFRLYSSGYTKMWLDGELVVDSWRQNWLPWTHLPRLNLTKGKKYDLKIEWIYNEGYISLKYLTPEDDIYKNSISLYSEVGDQIDYYFVQGNNTDEVIKGYREITGKTPMMPKWAMGLWQCRERYTTQDELLSVVKEFRDRKIPLDNIVQDWFYWPVDKWGDHDFDSTRFPNPKLMIDSLHKKLNTNIMISVWPKFYVGTKNYDLFNSKGLLYTRNVEKQEKDWVEPGYVSTFYDPYSMEAQKLFWERIDDKLFSLGIDAWWLDATEPDIHSNLSRKETRLRIGPTHFGSVSRYLNTFSLMNSKAVYEGQRKTAPDKRVFILTRSAFAGQQRYSAATWSGDVAARWYDLKIQISAGLNFSLSGIPYWTTDIGGFAVEPRFENPTKSDTEEWRELNTRWFQFGTFCPLFRVHGQFPYREMFNIAPDNHPAYKTMLKYDKLRYRLMPYIYSLTGMVTQNDYTIMRALVMDFGNDSNVLSIDDQFMFGPSFLINPVTEYKSRERNVYLPKQNGWFEFNSGKYFSGGQTITAEAPYENIPIFVKEGSIIPSGPEIEFTSEKSADPIRLNIYTGQDATFTLYEDENVNNNYEKGLFSTITFNYNEKSKTLTVDERKGEFPGMLKTRTFEVKWFTKDTNTGFDLDINSDEVYEYNGEKLTIRMK